MDEADPFRPSKANDKMYLTQQTDFALRVLLYLVVNKDELVKIGTIAETYDISHSHLMKVVTALVKGGFVLGIRGKGGGLRLARPANEIKVGEVVRHMEPMEFLDCRSNKGRYCILHGSCKLFGVVGEAANHFLDYLDQYDLEWIVRESGGLDLIDEESEIYKQVHGDPKSGKGTGKKSRSGGAKVVEFVRNPDCQCSRVFGEPGSTLAEPAKKKTSSNVFKASKAKSGANAKAAEDGAKPARSSKPRAKKSEGEDSK